MISFSEITGALKTGVSQVAAILKETIRLPYAKTYLAASVVLICLFTVITFPVEILIKRELQGQERLLGGNLLIGDMDIRYVGDSSIDKFDFTWNNGDELHLSDIVLDFNTLGLVFNHILKRDYRLDGSFSFTRLKYDSEKIRISGTANGNIDLRMQRNPFMMKKGDVTVLLQNAVIILPPFNLPENFGGFEIKLPPVNCPSLTIEITFDESVIRLKRAVLSGKDLRGMCSGTVSRNRFFRNSSLNLNIAIDENSGILESYKMLVAKSITDEKLNIQIKGTVGQPSIEMAR